VRLRVVAYNVHGFRDDRATLLRVLEHLRPDVLLLNETGSRRRLSWLAGSLGMDLATDPPAVLRRRAKDAVLVRPPLALVVHRQHRFERSAFMYPRAALVARVGVADPSTDRPSSLLCAVCVHLGLDPRERRDHAGQLLRLLERRDGPVVVGGDLNERPGRGAAELLGRRLHDAGGAPTFPAVRPTARIDHVFASADVTVERAFVPDLPRIERASDHLPVAADLLVEG
jgi:endonuclease/exonuclease/phosphatase family metal-dependent hydrolase